MQKRSTVQREDLSKPKGFSPKTQEAQVGDAIFWFNNDSHTSHQPYPKLPPGKPGDWGPPIPAQNPSQQLNLNQAGTYYYQCAAHADETGEIIVANAVMIGPSGTGAATFAPATIQIVVDQCVSWGNSDTSAHQPTPDHGSAWLANPIQPGDISVPIAFATIGPVPYHCALHKNAAGEKGTIMVNAPKKP
jgi:plastocyanin